MLEQMIYITGLALLSFLIALVGTFFLHLLPFGEKAQGKLGDMGMKFWKGMTGTFVLLCVLVVIQSL